uniref:RING-type E3 ubiquitin transferase n=1 Tax=Xenopus tropicalis TaxID=8364 RepID=A0A803JC67_XENTR
IGRNHLPVSRFLCTRSKTCAYKVQCRKHHQMFPEEQKEALDSECPICLETFDDVSYIEPCKHKFCFLCIETWIQVNGSCPMCRQHIRNIVMCEPDGRNGNVPVTADMTNEEGPLPAVGENPVITPHC